MRKRRRAPVHKGTVLALDGNIEGIKRGGIAITAALYDSRGRLFSIAIHDRRLPSNRHPRFNARLVGHSFVIYDEWSTTANLPPYIGRQFRNKDELHLLMAQMLAAYIMVAT